MTTRSFRPSLAKLITIAAATVLLAACSVQDLIESGLSRVEGVGDVTIDFSEEGGIFSITSEDGEDVLAFDVDAQGRSTITTPEGTIDSSFDGEVPEEVSDAIDLPRGFQPQMVSRFESDEEGDQAGGVVLHGTIAGDMGSILDELETSLEARWEKTERVMMDEEGQVAMVYASDADEQRGVHATLTMDQGDDEPGLLQIVVTLGS